MGDTKGSDSSAEENETEALPEEGDSGEDIPNPRTLSTEDSGSGEDRETGRRSVIEDSQKNYGGEEVSFKDVEAKTDEESSGIDESHELAKEVMADESGEEDSDDEESSLNEILEHSLLERARNASPSLKAELGALVELHFKDLKQSFYFDWNGPEPTISSSADGEPDTKITIKSDDATRIASGKLNPQIAMMSHKIQVEGKPGPAVYFFNLFRSSSS